MLSDADHTRVSEYTRQLFGGSVSIRWEEDPEYPAEYFVVSAVATGTVDELVAKNNEWHYRIAAMIGSGHPYRLMIDPQ